MALLKNVVHPTGLVVTYWVIRTVQAYYADALLDATLGGYLTADALKNNETPPEPITSVMVRIPFMPTMDPPITLTDMRTVIYANLEMYLAQMPDDPLYQAVYDNQLP